VPAFLPPHFLASIRAPDELEVYVFLFLWVFYSLGKKELCELKKKRNF